MRAGSASLRYNFIIVAFEGMNSQHHDQSKDFFIIFSRSHKIFLIALDATDNSKNEKAVELQLVIIR